MVARMLKPYTGRLSDVLGVMVSGPIETDEGDRWRVSLLDADADDVGASLYFESVDTANEAARRVAEDCGLALVLVVASEGGAA